MTRLLIAALVLILASPAFAQAKKPALTGNPVQDIKNAVGQPGGFLPGEKLIQNAPCDFNWFAALTAKNLGDQIRFCDMTKLADDVQAALDSATAFKDQAALSCLTPGLAIVKAAIGTPLPIDPNAPAGTQPAVKPPGLVLIFQKFREFVLANGIASCKSWVNVTIAAGNPLGQ